MTITAKISELTDKQFETVLRYQKLGFKLIPKKEVSANRKPPRTKGKNVEWFKENLSTEDFKDFEAIRAEKKGIAGFHKASAKYIDKAEENEKIKKAK